MATKKSIDQAIKYNESGLAHYQTWELEGAVTDFQKAVKANPENPDYHLNLTKAYARSGDYDKAMQALGGYLQTEPDSAIAERYERLFSSAMDEVERVLIAGAKELGLPIQQTGKAIQMWLEYRITIGRRPLRISKPPLWAAGLALAIIKINFVEISRQEVAAVFQVSPRSLKDKFKELVETLDLMPADYRYFTGEENPLDKLVEAAELLEKMDKNFLED